MTKFIFNMNCLNHPDGTDGYFHYVQLSRKLIMLRILRSLCNFSLFPLSLNIKTKQSQSNN